MGTGHSHAPRPQPGQPTPGHAGARHRTRMVIAFALISGFFAVELGYGLLSGSLALLSDAGHMAADVVAFDLSDVGFAGAGHDPVAALVFCAPARVAHSVIHGRVVIRDGQLATVELPRLAELHRALARRLVRDEA